MSTLDLAVVAVYLVVILTVGIACRGKQSSDSDYFVNQGGFSRAFGALAIGLSIAATFFSGVSLLAYPSVVIQKGVTVAVASVLLLPVSALIAGRWFLPIFLKTGTREPYEIIERRFGYPARALASLLFVALRISWLGTLIYVPTMALMSGYQLEERWFWPLVLTIGGCSTAYTVVGGLRGVIITDALQFLFMFLGILWPIATVVRRASVDWSTAWNYLAETGRLEQPSFEFSWTEPFTFWSMLCGFTVANLGIYMADQMTLQRYLTSRDLGAAQRAFAINILGVMTAISLLACLGLALSVWYGLVAPGQAPAVADRVFPQFIASELPTGAPGLIFAAILAATMSSMTSGINALAGSITLDLRSRQRARETSAAGLRLARLTSFAVGAGATMAAGWVGSLGSIFEITQTVTGVFLGPLLVCMLFSALPTQLSAAGLIAGVVIGSICGCSLIGTAVDRLWIGPVAAGTTALVPCLELGARAIFRAGPVREVS